MKVVRSLSSLLIIALSLMACDKDEDEYKQTHTIIGEWELTALVNISDQHKYLGRIVEFGYHVYKTEETDGEIIVQSKWGLDADEETLILHNGLYGGDNPIEYRIMDLTEASLKLERHYTLDNKDAYLEYHFTRVE